MRLFAFASAALWRCDSARHCHRCCRKQPSCCLKRPLRCFRWSAAKIEMERRLGYRNNAVKCWGDKRVERAPEEDSTRVKWGARESLFGFFLARGNFIFPKSPTLSATLLQENARSGPDETTQWEGWSLKERREMSKDFQETLRYFWNLCLPTGPSAGLAIDNPLTGD